MKTTPAPLSESSKRLDSALAQVALASVAVAIAWVRLQLSRARLRG